MRISKTITLSVLTAFCAPRIASADTITWSQLAPLPAASKIAVCGGGRLYYLDNDRWLWADTNRTGRGPAWQRLSRLVMKVASLSCAAGRLYVLSSERMLYRNDGDDLNLRWQVVGKPTWARQVTAATLGVGAVFYALSTDGVLLTSETGTDESWRKLGKTLAAAERISTPSLRDVFGLDADGRLYVNHGRGLGPYWRNLDAPAGTMEIASANARGLYALVKGSLWQGSVSHEVRSLRIASDAFNPWATLILGNIGITIREVCLSQRVNPELLGEERLPRPGPVCTVHLQTTVTPLLQGYGLHPVDATGPRFTRGHFDAFSSTRLTASLVQDRLQLFAAFGNTRCTCNSPVGPLGFDIVNTRLSGDLVPTKDSWGETVFSLANFSFNGELHGTDIPSTVATWFVDFKGEMERGLGPQLADTVASAGVQAAIRQILLEYANFVTHETWQGIAYGGILIEGHTLQFRVER